MKQAFYFNICVKALKVNKFRHIFNEGFSNVGKDGAYKKKMFSILSAITTKADVVCCIYEVMIKLVSPQRAQANSKLENPFGSIGVQDIKNILFRGLIISKVEDLKSDDFSILQYSTPIAFHSSIA